MFVFGMFDVLLHIYAVYKTKYAIFLIGYDPKGCTELSGKLVHTNKWIGTTEVAALLRYIGIR